MVGMVDHATMYVFFAYETQGENPILTILAYTLVMTTFSRTPLTINFFKRIYKLKKLLRYMDRNL